MNVEIGTEASQFPEKEYINGIFLAVYNIFFCFLPQLLQIAKQSKTLQVSVNVLSGFLAVLTLFLYTVLK
jgi:hypothetical protein